ncbi:hypothetical protein G647_07359 [Cladophialophora carrionii CBS 160.54]|uniref:Uncharacterized protein n=1 Tax=Cladophialophora carrionii CBS 160.54 TaxID=1279043 RepID=V9D302_9EURO|nr:uncharacterized protein G647_07359 [Cladophialophora carrionii CBS 160.54]ETI21016.1 hypothetical protein G647_07359 [Cladophialophora carrionii CBS 160.54]
MSSSRAELESVHSPAPAPTSEHDTDKHIRHKLSSSGVVVIRVSVSEKYIVLSLDDKTIHVFSAAGEPIVVFRDYPQNAWSLALRDDVLLSGEIGGGIRCWDLAERHLIGSLPGHTETVRALGFADATTAVSASKDALLKIWDLGTGSCQGTLSGHGDSILDLAVVGEYAESASKDGTAKVWSLREPRNVSTMSGHTGPVYRVICHSDGILERVYTGSMDHDVRIWDLSTGRPLAVLKGHESLVTHICVSSCGIDSSAVVTGGADGNIIIWSWQDHSILHMISKAHEGAVTSLDAGDGHILSGGSDGTVKMWDLRTGKLQRRLGMNTEAVWSVSLGRGASQSHAAIVASAQRSSSPVGESHDAVLDVSEPWSTSYISGTLNRRAKKLTWE